MNFLDNNVSRLNDIEYIYNIVLFNSNSDAVILSQDAIKLLVIEDKITEPFTDGFIIIDNTNNVLQRSYKIDNKLIEAEFDFNMSDRDYLAVEIIPKFTEEQKKGDIDSKLWNLSYLFTIYDTEDIDTESSGESIKKLYFEDHQKFELSDKISNYSSSNYKKDNIPQYLRDDSDRTEYTGNILKQLFESAFKSSKFSDIWDIGSNKIFYTSPAGSDYLSDYKYIYNLHQSAVINDFCILSKERYTELWKLESFSDIIGKALNINDKNKSGEYQIEAFSIADMAEMPIIPLETKVPTDYSVNINIAFGDLSKIDNFKLIEIARQDIMDEFKTSVAFSYNFDDGKFKIEHHDINDIKTFYETEYISKLKSKGSIFKIGDNQLNNLNVNYNYGSTYQPDNTFEHLSRNNVLKSAYLMGLGVEFSSIGMTHRQSGSFFSIRKDHNYYNNEFESKLQGQWFCTGVTHIFSGSIYKTDMMGVKLNYN